MSLGQYFYPNSNKWVRTLRFRFVFGSQQFVKLKFWVWSYDVIICFSVCHVINKLRKPVRRLLDGILVTPSKNARFVYFQETCSQLAKIYWECANWGYLRSWADCLCSGAICETSKKTWFLEILRVSLRKCQNNSFLNC